MSTPIWRLLVFLFAYSKNYEEHLEAVAQSLYLRNLAENVTMASFLGWLTILHYGPNRDVYPVCDFDSFAVTVGSDYLRSSLHSTAQTTRTTTDLPSRPAPSSGRRSSFRAFWPASYASTATVST